MTIALPAIDTPQRRSVEQICDDLALLALVVVSFVALATFQDYGLGWDDYTHSEYADLLIRMYGSGFADRHALSFANLYMYGGGFDVAAALLHKILPLGLFETRRLLGAAVGIIGLTLTWRVARRVSGPFAGLVALLLLALCPIFYGHMFMNPKDAPFAVAMVVVTLGLVRLADEYPAPSPRTILLVGFGAGVALGSRILGGLGLFYAVIGLAPLLIADIRSLGIREALSRLSHVIYLALPGLLFGYLVMGLMWPWSVLDPLNPFRAVAYFSDFFEKPWKELFDGTLVSVPDMPWSYLPTLFVLQTPELMLGLTALGIGGSLVALTRGDVEPRRKAALLMLVTAALLPLLITVVKRPALYNGIRHFIFLLPPMAILGGIAASWIGKRLQNQGTATLRIGAAILFIGLLSPLVGMVRLHPYEYAHFNHILGSESAAKQKFMLDYWGLSLKQASDALKQDLADNNEQPPPGRKWKVAVCGPQRPAQVALGPDFTIGWDSKGADFAMTLGEFYCRGLNAPVIADIKRDDVTFARVYDIRGHSITSLLSIPAP